MCERVWICEAMETIGKACNCETEQPEEVFCENKHAEFFLYFWPWPGWPNKYDFL